ncbi:TetR/AcrR family transcriptional regulator [Kitasatospora sp. NPDC051170]|uniref:TetR/AcrR family transcriptional regulator n=1 Tax=Kitasatospora sp. NPDC051170 TaxID=3364056 RepID=UPI00378F7413
MPEQHEEPREEQRRAPRKSPGRPPRISLDQVLDAARRVVTEEGVAKLTMRRLATEVGSTPMALYHHVRDKDELLVLLLDDYARRNLRRPELPADPQERVLLAATAIHDALAGCPWIVEVLTADDLMSTASLWFVEQIVEGLLACGLTPERAVHGYRAIWYYTAGEIMIRATAGRRRADSGHRTYRERVFADLDAHEFPCLARVAADWAEITAEDTYRQGLRALVYGLLAVS